MSEGRIPVGSGDLPIDVAPMDESQVYVGRFVRATVSPKTDKNGKVFCSIQVEVLEGDFEGYTVMQNYLPLPMAVNDGMSKSERIRVMNAGVAFERFARAFSIKSAMPVVSLTDLQSCRAWQDWIAGYYGSTGKFTVKNQ